MGVRGMTSFTDDSAATFNIAFAQKVSKANNELVVFRHAGDSIYDLSFMLDDKPAVLKYTDSTKVVFNVFGDFSNLTCKIQKSNSIQSSITITGIVLQDSLHRGGLWHNAGVGAAPYRMVLSEAYYEQEAKFLNPDLVIIDLGTNDFLYANRIEADLRNTIITVIEKVRGANPNADIILTDAQEMKYKGKRTTVANEFSSMMYSIAKEKNCGFWSYYHVSGGRNAWHYWADAKLTQGDGIHLNGKGSELKGTLLFHAIDNSVSLIRNEKVNSKAMKIEDETMNLTITSIDSGTVVVDTVANENINTSLIRKKEKIKVKDTKSPYFYIVKKNDTVGAISLKTKVPIAKIRTLNHLKNDLIKPGQKLKLK